VGWEMSVNLVACPIRDTKNSEQLFPSRLCILMPHLLHNMLCLGIKRVEYSDCSGVDKILA
jgi:hypothetical protein